MAFSYVIVCLVATITNADTIHLALVASGYTLVEGDITGNWSYSSLRSLVGTKCKIKMYPMISLNNSSINICASALKQAY